MVALNIISIDYGLELRIYSLACSCGYFRFSMQLCANLFINKQPLVLGYRSNYPCLILNKNLGVSLCLIVGPAVLGSTSTPNLLLNSGPVSDCASACCISQIYGLHSYDCSIDGTLRSCVLTTLPVSIELLLYPIGQTLSLAILSDLHCFHWMPLLHHKMVSVQVLISRQ